jgi:hypothetical protein
MWMQASPTIWQVWGAGVVNLGPAKPVTGGIRATGKGSGIRRQSEEFHTLCLDALACILPTTLSCLS